MHKKKQTKNQKRNRVNKHTYSNTHRRTGKQPRSSEVYSSRPMGLSCCRGSSSTFAPLSNQVTVFSATFSGAFVFVCFFACFYVPLSERVRFCRCMYVHICVCFIVCICVCAHVCVHVLVCT